MAAALRSAAQAVISSEAKDAVRPFGDGADTTGTAKTDTGGNTEEAVWCGPAHIGPCVCELYGPLQLAFILLSIVAVALLIVEIVREDCSDAVRIIGACGFLLVSTYLVWLAKAIYVLKMFRRQIARFRELNEQLQGNLVELASQNEDYKRKNEEHEKLNTQLRSENMSYYEKNQEHARLNTELEGKITDLKRVEDQLEVLSAECNGNVSQARSLLERLERNLRLDTVNTVFLFFDRVDRKKTGKLGPEEISLFVDNLSFLWRHVPTFDKEHMKASLIAQGGITLEQVHELVDGMMLEEDVNNPQELTEKLERSFRSEHLSSMIKECSQEAQSAVGDGGNRSGADIVEGLS